ncbi:potassium-transporting ATPase subunit KdpC [Pseudoroseicyclus aestuarii]|uniref:Potassium-transporting ATPase KdpC subunit n=1 Tax=Pseudoroseicyclus aestuarii TaxID=1795041 RepID=A0A318SNU6_9RHOB|nr:potassium-transporting ATPase subunit KdpC [Pseudoroseicyclus aestuarii]PYE82285.1 K+-transporting ATPase ATPase C chain [Pseudoroseicyclus aestuarii]
MTTILRPALVLLALMTLMTGLAYPLALTGIAQAAMPWRASGSLVEQEGRVVGSALIGQAFAAPEYLHPRPSAVDYDAAAAGASNFGPSAPALLEAVQNRAADWRRETGQKAVPLDAVTASASGLDPDISPENARGQAARIAAARGAETAEVLRILDQATTGPWLGLFGPAHVDVLGANRALDAALPRDAG